MDSGLNQKNMAKKRKRRTKKDACYISNKELLEEVKKSQKQGKMTERLGEMLIMLARRYSSQGSYSGYTYRSDMESYALTIVCRGWKSFDAERYDNPFAYFTQAIKRAFWQFLIYEKGHRNIKDALLLQSGEPSSHTYEEDQREVMINDEFVECVKKGKITTSMKNLLIREISKRIEDKEAASKILEELSDTILNLKHVEDDSVPMNPYDFILRNISMLSEKHDPTFKKYSPEDSDG